MALNIQHREEGNKGMFYIENDVTTVAKMTYSKAGSDKIIIDHTEVDESLKGQGAGAKLVVEAVEFARKNDIKIVPLCPFANAQFKRHPEYNDVLA